MTHTHTKASICENFSPCINVIFERFGSDRDEKSGVSSHPALP